MKKITTILVTLALLLTACRTDITADRTIDEEPTIFPDYKGVTVPPNIAPLNFQLMDAGSGTPTCLIVEGGSVSFQVRGDDGVFDIPRSKWRDLLCQQAGSDIRLTVCRQTGGEWEAYRPFTVSVATDDIDPYLVYRLVPPGYSPWDRMGIYQRDITSFDVDAIYENTLTDLNCQNCHSFQMQNPDKMVFHSRAWFSGTVVADNGRMEKLNTKTPETITAFTYPSWHPTEDIIAFSVNGVGQFFYMSHPNRLEGFDSASDIVVYDVKSHQAFSCDQLKRNVRAVLNQLM